MDEMPLTAPLVFVREEVTLDFPALCVDHGDRAVHRAGDDVISLDLDAPDRGTVVVKDVYCKK